MLDAAGYEPVWKDAFALRGDVRDDREVLA
jgi:hypothetical protein